MTLIKLSRSLLRCPGHEKRCINAQKQFSIKKPGSARVKWNFNHDKTSRGTNTRSAIKFCFNE